MTSEPLLHVWAILDLSLFVPQPIAKVRLIYLRLARLDELYAPSYMLRRSATFPKFDVVR